MIITADGPLDWPLDWQRTPLQDRVDGRMVFRRPTGPWTFPQAMAACCTELERLGASHVRIISNFPIGRMGVPTVGRPRPDDQAILLRCTVVNQVLEFARDTYIEAEGNLRSITLAVEAMRALERHGGSDFMRRATSGFVRLEPPENCWDVLGITAPNPTLDHIATAFRERARAAHPDAGGNTDAMARLTRARDRARELVSRANG